MRRILAASNRELLKQYAASRVLLAFDYDGTLAPIVDDPSRAEMGAGTRVLLRKLCRRYPCAVISGRARHDVTAHLGSVGICAVVGNHGMEPGGDSGRALATVRRWRGHLQTLLGAFPGVFIEDKRLSLSVHYRRSPQKRKALAAIWEAVGELPSARIIGGKQVVNLVPEGAPHKGLALERLRRESGCDTAIYVGDDETDEDVFAYRSPWPLLGIRVCHSRTTGAAYYIRSQREIDVLLRAFLACRKPNRRMKGGNHEKSPRTPRRRESRAA